MTDMKGKILVIDDDSSNRMLMTTYMEISGYSVSSAENGAEGLEKLRSEQFDLVLLDLIMPELDGYGVLKQMKASETLRHIPIIVISSVEDMQSVIRCIEMGATDHLPKPFNPLMLLARLDSSLATKRLHDQEQNHLKEIKLERERSEKLLLNILPGKIAERLKRGETHIVNRFDEVTVLFADIVGFTGLLAKLSPEELINLLNCVFSKLDGLAEKYGVEKIKTIGDAYMVVAGVPEYRKEHAEAIAHFALEAMVEIAKLERELKHKIEIRIGIHTGPAVGGIIGEKKFSYDLWGHTVNIANRMESHGMPGKIQVTQQVHDALKNDFTFVQRGMMKIKGIGDMNTFFLVETRKPLEKPRPNPKP